MVLKARYAPMTVFLPTVAVAFGAFCVWLTVRVVNRRERWAKWTLAGVVGVPVLYAASFGPACWIMARPSAARLFGTEIFDIAYTPIGRLIYVRSPLARALYRYGDFGIPDGEYLFVPGMPDNRKPIILDGPL